MTQPDPETIAQALIDDQPTILDTLNGLYEDATLFVARIHCDRRDATAARAVRVTASGIDLVITDVDGEHAETVAFLSSLDHQDELYLLFFALVTDARARSGEMGTTSVEKIIATASSYRTFFTTVDSVAEINPALRQITFRGGDLANDFAPVGPDTFLYLLLPPAGHTELTIDETFSWAAVRTMPPELQPVGAYYTLRDWRPDACELDIWVVIHGEGDDAGAASGWALEAQSGDPVALWGPRTAWDPPEGTDSLLLVADETGLPAVAMILETVPETWPIRVIAEVADESVRQPLRAAEHIEVTWLHRDGTEAGTTSAMFDAVVGMDGPLSGHPYVWGGAESRTMTRIRRHVRDQWGLAKDQVSLVAYWRHTAHAADTDD